MTQRIFDVEKEKDMQDLWDILPECIVKIKKNTAYNTYSSGHIDDFYETAMLKINWHDKTEITRPIQEATETDVGKLCIFWNDNNDLNFPVYKVLTGIKDGKYESFTEKFATLVYDHARRLTKQEIKELC